MIQLSTQKHDINVHYLYANCFKDCARTGYEARPEWQSKEGESGGGIVLKSGQQMLPKN